MPATRQVIAGAGLTGGGALSANVTIAMAQIFPGPGNIVFGGSGNLVKSVTLDPQGRVVDGTLAAPGTDFIPASAGIIAGAGLTGGGIFSGGTPTISMPNVGPGAGVIGGSSKLIRSITLDDQGRVTAATATDLGALATGVLQVTTTTGALTSFAPTATRVPFGGTGGGTLTDSDKLVFDNTDASNSYLKIGQSAANASWIWMRGVPVALVDSGGVSFGDVTADGHATFLWSNGVIRQTIGKGTVASAAGAVWDGFKFSTSTVTVSGATNITTATGFNAYTFKQATISAASALTITAASTVFIEGAPAGGGAGPATLTASYALWVNGGSSWFNGNVVVGGTPTTFPANHKLNVTDTVNSFTTFSLYNNNPSATAANRNWGVLVNSAAYGDFAIKVSNAKDGDPLSAGTNRFVVNSTAAGIGVNIPVAALEVVTASDTTNGAPSVYDTKFFTIGTGGASGGAVFLSYNQSTNTGFIGALTPGTSFRDLKIQATTSGASVVTIGSGFVATGIGTTGVASTTLTLGGSRTLASAASAVWDNFSTLAVTLTLSGSTNITTANGLNAVTFNAPTYSNASVAISHANTVYVAGEPAVTGGATLAAPFALRVDGRVRLGSTYETPVVTTAPLQLYVSGNAFLITRDTLNHVEVSVGNAGSGGFVSTQTAHRITLSANNGGGQLTVETDGRVYGNHIHNTGTVTGTTNQYVASGTYTPTLTNATNVAASTPRKCQWVRVGNVVTVSGLVDIDPTTTATLTQLGVSLPIASNLAAATDLAGAAAAPSLSAANAASASVQGDLTNDRAIIQWTPVDVSNQTWSFVFTYEVL